MRLFVLPDYLAARIDLITPDSGAWPPEKGQILIERAALPVLGKSADPAVAVSLGKGDENPLRVAGIVHAPGLAPAWMERQVYGWINVETARSIGAETAGAYLRITVSDGAMDKGRIGAVAAELKAALEARGVRVSHIEIPKPGEHPHQTQMMSLLYLLETFGLLALLLSGILVASTISSLMARQLRQIGIMKAVGGGTGQIAAMYYALVLFLGTLASFAATPIASSLARVYAAFSARMLNFAIFDASIPLKTYAVQLAIGIVVPALAASPAIFRGSSITVREALADPGFSEKRRDSGPMDRLLGAAAGSYRPLLLSLRNALRKRTRFVLTMAVLAAGGAVFMTSMNVSSSIDNTVEERYGAMRFDFMSNLTEAVPTEKLDRAVGSLPGLAAYESWGRLSCSRVYEGGREGNSFFLVAFPADSKLQTTPVISSGRWILPGDTDAVVLNQRVMSANPDLKLGDRVQLKTDYGETEWTLVGVTTELMAGFVGYAVKERFDRVNGLAGMAKTLIVAGTDRSPEGVSALAARVEAALKAEGIGVSTLTKLAGARKMAEEHFLVLALMLALMALLVLAVGVLGLSSAMSVNVLERTREIGIMRSIGATTHAVGGMVVVEALTVGFAGWIAACLIAWPVSAIVASRFGMIFFEAPLEFGLSLGGMCAWLGLATGAALIAAIVPALNAASIPVREAIALE